MRTVSKKYKVTSLFMVASLFIVTILKAQSPDAFSYQVVLRDANGFARVNTNISIDINIVQGSTEGISVYEETHNTTTNNQGLVTLAIGTGSVNNGSFSGIDWSKGPYYIKVAVDGVDFGSSQLLSVPYAKYAETAGMISNSGPELKSLPATSTGVRNTAYGEGALNSNTTGSDNSAFGYSALYANTTGLNNTASGSYASNHNTTGYNNVANGYMTLFCNTTGNNNYATGYRTLYSNTTGSINTASGSYALDYNTTGKGNVANGYATLHSNTTGAYNTASGSYALSSNTTGNYNVAHGNGALSSNTTGYYNTAIGNNALSKNTTGIGNCASGYYSLSVNSTGNYNTAIGYSANPAAANLTNTGAFGYNARPTASNTIVLGNSSIKSIGGYVPWSNLSDARFKTNVKENVPGLDFILKLKPVTFTWNLKKLDAFNNIQESEDMNDAVILNSRNEKEKKVYTGFLAQQVEEAAKSCDFDFSGIIKPENDQTPYNLSYAEFVVPLVKAIQEQQEQIDELKQLIEKLTIK